jgi:hypothetical protein
MRAYGFKDVQGPKANALFVQLMLIFKIEYSLLGYIRILLCRNDYITSFEAPTC